MAQAGLGLPWDCCSYVFQPTTASGAAELARMEVASMRSQKWFVRADHCVHWGRSYCNATPFLAVNARPPQAQGQWLQKRGAAVSSVEWRETTSRRIYA